MEKDTKKKMSPIKLFLLQYFKFITPLAVILILVLSFLFLLKPKYNEVKVSGALNLEAKQESLANKETYLTQLKSLEKNYESLPQSDISKIDNILPSKEDVPGLLVQIEEIAEANGFNLLSLDISPVQNLAKSKQKSLINQLLITATIEGGEYSDLKLFLNQLESNLRLFDVKSLNFTSGSNLYTLNISTYYLASK
ncbi:MAG: hypothetical protein DRP84_12385 [Spirochaetes bacterium]|nr:MAG: hypothetical protein DRP84_12385 [Spirochaetota bacterium]